MRGKKKVLIVDDHEHLLIVLSLYLRLEDYQVVTASGGREALLKIESERPDLVLLDLQIPDFDGRVVLETIRSDPVHQDLPVILLSTQDEEEDLRWTLLLGPDLYLTQPFDPGVLCLTIQRMLEMAEMREEREEEGGCPLCCPLF